MQLKSVKNHEEIQDPKIRKEKEANLQIPSNVGKEKNGLMFVQKIQKVVTHHAATGNRKNILFVVPVKEFLQKLPLHPENYQLNKKDDCVQKSENNLRKK
jgi:hypothetical protein